MATSGSIDHNRTRDEIITAAYRHCGAIALGEAPSSNETNTAATALENMIKAWQAEGTHLWKVEECTLFLTVGTEKYTLGTDRAAKASDTVVTKLGGDEAAAQTVLTVDSSTGMAASDVAGIVLDSGSVDWTTISSVDSSTQITVASGLTGAAAEDSIVYTYTTRLGRPLRITSARRRDWTGSNPTDTPFANMYSHSDYFDLPNKKDQGVPISGYYDPRLSAGDLYIWNAPNTSNDTVQFTAHLSIDDFDTASTNPDFPAEWLEALEWNLAVRLASDVGTPPSERTWIKSQAAESKYLVTQWDSEPVSLFFQPAIGIG